MEISLKYPVTANTTFDKVIEDIQIFDFKNYLESFGKIVYQSRNLRREKLKTVAGAIGVSHTVISLIENGKYECLKIRMIFDLCKYLNIPANEVLTQFDESQITIH